MEKQFEKLLKGLPLTKAIKDKLIEEIDKHKGGGGNNDNTIPTKVFYCVRKYYAPELDDDLIVDITNELEPSYDDDEQYSWIDDSFEYDRAIIIFTKNNYIPTSDDLMTEEYDTKSDICSRFRFIKRNLNSESDDVYTFMKLNNKLVRVYIEYHSNND